MHTSKHSRAEDEGSTAAGQVEVSVCMCMEHVQENSYIIDVLALCCNWQHAFAVDCLNMMLLIPLLGCLGNSVCVTTILSVSSTVTNSLSLVLSCSTRPQPTLTPCRSPRLHLPPHLVPYTPSCAPGISTCYSDTGTVLTVFLPLPFVVL